MNTSANKIYSTGKAKLSLAFLFALAVLLLVVSCPLKRLLQSNDIVNTSTTTRTNQTKINSSLSTQLASVENCCAVKKTAVFAKTNLVQKVKLSSPSYVSNLFTERGFDIHYSLSRIKDGPAYVVSSNTSSLPIYLQHLRLLIWFFSPFKILISMPVSMAYKDNECFLLCLCIAEYSTKCIPINNRDDASKASY